MNFFVQNIINEPIAVCKEEAYAETNSKQVLDMLISALITYRVHIDRQTDRWLDE